MKESEVRNCDAETLQILNSLCKQVSTLAFYNEEKTFHFCVLARPGVHFSNKIKYLKKTLRTVDMN